MELNYIPDKEINLFERDILGTLPYVKTLIEVIDKCKTPFTIGLLGGWGSGKSSIIKTLQEYINEESDSKCFIYDAWKYSNDPFRRTFILELLEFLDMHVPEEIKSKFYESESCSTEFSITKIVGYKKSRVKTAKEIMQPEKFEEIFREIIRKKTDGRQFRFKFLKEVKVKVKADKIIIAIDNIDRCHIELAKELLLTIKNFLKMKNVIFIIPVDEVGLKKYLSMSQQDPKEFLRKLFDTTLKVKKFSEYELFEFSKSLNSEYKLNLSDSILSIIAQEFSKNPRRIIQFLNILQTEIFLAEKQEENGNIPKGVITDQKEILTKLLIIREEWPKLYGKLYDDLSLLNKINNGIKSDSYAFDRDSNTWNIKNKEINNELDEKQYRFLVRTSSISSNELEPFFISKDVLHDIPDQVAQFVKDQDWESLKKLIEAGQLSIDRLFDYISKRINEDIIKRGLMRTVGFNLLSLVFSVFSDSDYSNYRDNLLRKVSFRSVKAMLNKGEIADLIFHFNPDKMTSFAKYLYEKGDKTLTEKIVLAINNTNLEDLEANENVNKFELDFIPVLKSFIEKYKDYPESLKDIKNAFSQLLISWPEFYGIFEDAFLDEAIIGHIINEKLATSFIESLTKDLKDNANKNLIEVIKSLNKSRVLSIKSKEVYVGKIMSYIETNDWVSLKFWLNSIIGFVEDVKNEQLQTKILNALGLRFDFLFDQYKNNKLEDLNLDCYKSFLIIAREIYISNGGVDVKPINWLRSFLSRNESSQVYLFANEQFKEIIEHFQVYDWGFKQNLINKFVNLVEYDEIVKVAETVNLMMEKTTEDKGLNHDEIQRIIEKYISLLGSDKNKVIKGKIKDWVKKISTSNVHMGNTVKEIISSKITNEEIEGKVWLFYILEDIKFGDSLNLVISSITRADELDCFLSEANVPKKRVLKVLEDKLKSSNLDKRKIKKYLEIMIGYEDSLSKEEKNVVFENIVRPFLTSQKKKDQEFAIDVLSQLKEIPKSKRDIIRPLLKSITQKVSGEAYQKKIENIFSKIS